jgi:hypothetical protein
MANDKYYGFKPKSNKTIEQVAKFEQFHPFEFRKGMDYELTELGCMRLKESTIEEREKATEKIIKNLEKHPAYYSALLQFESGVNYGSKINETTFSKFLENFTGNEGRGEGMQEVDKDFKNDKMEELKEAIKREMKSILKESSAAKKAAMADMEDEEGAPKKGKGKSKKDKPLRKDRFDKEEDAIKDILFRVDHKIDKKFYCPDDKNKVETKGEEEDNTMKDPAKGSLLYVKDCLMKEYETIKADSGGDIKAAKEAYDVLQKEANAEFEEIFKEFNEDFEKNEVGDIYKKEDFLFQTIKKLQERLKLGLDKARAGVEEEARGIRREVAQTQMTRMEALRLLEIVKENGISLREGTENVKVYYEIAKAAYLEGLANGLKI